MGRRVPVLYDPLVADHAQITSVSGGTSAERKDSNECERRNRDRCECAFRKMQGHVSLTQQRHDTAHQVADASSPQIVSGGRRVSHMFGVNTSLELYETAQFAWQSRIVIHWGV
jgi:hypothetical protein